MEEEQKRVHQNTGLTQVLPTAVLTRRLGEKGKKKKQRNLFAVVIFICPNWILLFNSFFCFLFFFFKGNMAIFSSCFLSWSLKNENSLFIPYV